MDKSSSRTNKSKKSVKSKDIKDDEEKRQEEEAQEVEQEQGEGIADQDVENNSQQDGELPENNGEVQTFDEMIDEVPRVSNTFRNSLSLPKNFLKAKKICWSIFSKELTILSSLLKT